MARGLPQSSEPLGGWERALALGVGITTGGGGAYAVFASSNQAGTAILLILSAIFLLIGIQGTPLIRFSTGSNTVELERRRRAIERVVNEIAKEEPARAAGIIQGAELALPTLGTISSSLSDRISAGFYAQNVATAISSMGYLVSLAGGNSDYGPDLIVADSRTTRVVYVSVKFRQQPGFDRNWPENSTQPHMENIPLLQVTNIQVPTTWAASMVRGAPAKLISWASEADNQVLQESLAELFDSIQPN